MELTADGIEAELRELRSRLAGAGAERASDAAADAVNSAQLTALGALLNTHADVRAIALRAGTGELARLREGVDQFDQQVSEQHAAVQAANTQLQTAVDAARAVLTDAGSGVAATPEVTKRLLQHSHRLAYTSFAPLLGPHLLVEGPFQPPFPSVFHMQLSKLTNTAQLRSQERAQQAAEAQRDALAQQAAHAAAPAAELPPMPPGWQPGDPIPTIPPDWKPGDPIPMAQPPPAATPSEEAARKKKADTPPQPLFDLDTGIDDDFVLNTEAVDSESDESSELGGDMSGSD